MVEPRCETQIFPYASYHALSACASFNVLMLMQKIKILRSLFFKRISVVWLALFLSSGCIRLERISTATPTVDQAPTVPPTDVISATSTPDYGWKDVNYLVESVCFEAALNIAGQVIKIPNASVLDTFYRQIEGSQLCEDPIEHVSYAFDTNEIIIGLWSTGTGCSSRYAVQHIQRDDAKKQETIELRFVIDGNCPYELVQPFWIALPQSGDFDVQIMVHK